MWSIQSSWYKSIHNEWFNSFYLLEIWFDSDNSIKIKQNTQNLRKTQYMFAIFLIHYVTNDCLKIYTSYDFAFRTIYMSQFTQHTYMHRHTHHVCTKISLAQFNQHTIIWCVSVCVCVWVCVRVVSSTNHRHRLYIHVYVSNTCLCYKSERVDR